VLLVLSSCGYDFTVHVADSDTGDANDGDDVPVEDDGVGPDADADIGPDADADVYEDAAADADAEACTTHASQDCVGGDVHWFNSCGDDEGVAVDCPALHSECNVADAECRCTGNWNGPGCDVCAPGWTGDDCAACVRYADPDGTGTDCDSWTNACPSVQDAIDAAAADSCVVWLLEGTYYTWKTAASDTVQLAPGIGVYGGFGGGETRPDGRDIEAHRSILDGRESSGSANQVSHVVTGPSSGTTAAILDGITIQGGNAAGIDPDDRGAGITNNGHDLTIRNCRIIDNEATRAAGIRHVGPATLRIENSFLGRNTASVGEAGGVNNEGGTLVVEDSIFVDNHGPYRGGAIYSAGSAGVTARRSLFLRSTGARAGGGIYGNGSSIVVEDCQFIGLCCDLASAVFFEGALTGCSGGPCTLQFRNSVFAGNIANHAAALRAWDDTATGAITNCTFVDNVCIAPGPSSMAAGALTVTNVISWYNTWPAWNGEGGSWNVSYSDIRMSSGVHAGAGNLAVNPGFVDYSTAADGTLTIAPTYDSALFQTIFTDSTKSWTPGSLAGKYIVRMSSGAYDRWYLIADNTATEVYAWGEAGGPFDTPTPAAGMQYRMMDLRLADGSPAIDAANGTVAPPQDIDGHDRVDDAATTDTGTGTPTYADLGAWEHL
jgi:hypothetical protein